MEQEYREAVRLIKTAIQQSQYEAVKSVNESQLLLYYSIGKYISINSRNGFWGQGAIETISRQLTRELPGLRGFSARNLRNMRLFYEEWTSLDTDSVSDNNFAVTTAKLEDKSGNTIWQTQLPKVDSFPIKEFYEISFTNHILIISRIKEYDERLFYIKKCAYERLTVEQLKQSIASDDYLHQGSLPNNFTRALDPAVEAFKAISTFKDEYLLDYINVEEIDIRDAADIDERIVENSIVNDVKNFILTFGKDFAFISNQYHIETLGEDQYIDLLFFNRELNCLVAVELKTGKFKTAYLGQLQGYLSVLDGYDRKPHENPAIGLILCKDMNKSFVDYVIQDYSKPMGVATYKTSKDMSEKLKKALPPIEELQKILDEKSDQQTEQEQMYISRKKKVLKL